MMEIFTIYRNARTINPALLERRDDAAAWEGAPHHVGGTNPWQYIFRGHVFPVSPTPRFSNSPSDVDRILPERVTDALMAPENMELDSEGVGGQHPLGPVNSPGDTPNPNTVGVLTPDNTTATHHEGLDTMGPDNDNNGHESQSPTGAMTSSHTSPGHVVATYTTAGSLPPLDNPAAAVHEGEGNVESQEQMENEHDVPQGYVVEGSAVADGPNTLAQAHPTADAQAPQPTGMQIVPPNYNLDRDVYPLAADTVSNLPPHLYASQIPPELMHGLSNAMPGGQILLQNAAYGSLYNHDSFEDDQEMGMTAFARLEFPDMNYYVNTYALKLGRDIAAGKKARQIEEAAARQQATALREPQTPMLRNAEKRSLPTYRSIVSESGGMLRYADDTDSDSRPRKRKRRKTKSTRSGSLHRSRHSTPGHQAKPNYQESQIRNLSPALDQDSRPSPYSVPLVPVHPPAGYPAQALNSISREHVKIQYSSKKELWELRILGRNGAFVDDILHYPHEVVSLRSGSVIQIGTVPIRFVLPDRVDEESMMEDVSSNAAERYSQGGKEMSFDFEQPHDESLLSDTSEDEPEDERAVISEMAEEQASENAVADEEDEIGIEDEDEDADDDDDDSPGRMVEEVAEETGEDDRELERVESDPKPKKKRGPGRPPKNGVMSKREQQEVRKALQQKAKKSTAESSTPANNKVSKPRKNSRDSTSPSTKKEKRKYKTRKPKDPSLPTAKEGGSGEEDKPVKEKKEKKPVKPPRSPSPVFNEADLTPEQLAKPAANYVTLIYEALSSSTTGGMSLPQIYRAIQRKYPYYKLRMATNGWQSSVRHNLSQHAAFCKVQRDGKGWLWSIVPGVPIEKDKKQRHMSPPQTGSGPMFSQPNYQAGPTYQAGPPQEMAHGPTHAPGMMGPQSQGPPPNSFPYHPIPPNGSSILNSGHRPYIGPMAQPQLVPPQSGSYSSPYGNPNPPPPPPPPQATGQTQPYGMSNNFASQPYRPPPPQQQPQQHQQLASNPAVTHAIEIFKSNLVAGLKNKQVLNSETIVESAVNRVLGKSQAAIFENPHEQAIMGAVRIFLHQLEMSVNPQPRPVQNPPPQTAPAPKISRPSLGPTRPTRPSMLATGASRNSPANLSPRLLPAFVSPSTASSSTLSTSPAPKAAEPASSAPANGIHVTNSLSTAGNPILPAASSFIFSNTNPGIVSTGPKLDSLSKIKGEAPPEPENTQTIGSNRPGGSGNDHYKGGASVTQSSTESQFTQDKKDQSDHKNPLEPRTSAAVLVKGEEAHKPNEA